MKQHETFSNETNEQGYFIVPKIWLQSIIDTQQKILSMLKNGSNFSETNSIGDYICEAEAKKLFGRKTTWFWNMRTSGHLPFSKVGNKVFYHKEDILKLLENNKHSEQCEFPLLKVK